jgi:hypothetical protein
MGREGRNVRYELEWNLNCRHGVDGLVHLMALRRVSYRCYRLDWDTVQVDSHLLASNELIEVEIVEIY